MSARAALPERRGCGVLAVSDLSVTYTERSTTSSSCTMKQIHTLGYEGNDVL